MRVPVGRVLLGFAAGVAAGWAAGLLRRPASAPYGSSAAEAIRLPQEDFGEPVEPAAQPEPEPTPETAGADEIAQEPTAPVDLAEVHAAAAEELREGHAEATELLADATPPAPPARRRRAPAKRTPKTAE